MAQCAGVPQHCIPWPAATSPPPTPHPQTLPPGAGPPPTQTRQPLPCRRVRAGAAAQAACHAAWEPDGCAGSCCCRRSGSGAAGGQGRSGRPRRAPFHPSRLRGRRRRSTSGCGSRNDDSGCRAGGRRRPPDRHCLPGSAGQRRRQLRTLGKGGRSCARPRAAKAACRCGLRHDPYPRPLPMCGACLAWPGADAMSRAPHAALAHPSIHPGASRAGPGACVVVCLCVRGAGRARGHLQGGAWHAYFIACGFGSPPPPPSPGLPSVRQMTPCTTLNNNACGFLC